LELRPQCSLWELHPDSRAENPCSLLLD